MLNIAAGTGDASDLANLSAETLEKLNLRGPGWLCIQRDGDSDIMRWICRAALDPQQDDQTVPNDDNESLRVGMGTPAPGELGEQTGRLSGPVQFVRKLMDYWRVEDAEVARLLGCDPQDIEYISAVLAGKRQLRGRDVQDRIAHLFYIRRALWSLFRDLDVENEWLREQHSMLKGSSPLSLMLEGSMENLLLAREYVESAAGVH